WVRRDALVAGAGLPAWPHAQLVAPGVAKRPYYSRGTSVRASWQLRRIRRPPPAAHVFPAIRYLPTVWDLGQPVGMREQIKQRLIHPVLRVQYNAADVNRSRYTPAESMPALV